MEGQGCCKEKPANSCSTEKIGSCGDKTGGCGPGCKCGCGTKGKCCPMTVIKGAVAGAIVMFAWFSASWMLLPWHKGAMTAPGAVGPTEMNTALATSFVLYLFGAALLTKILKKRTAGCCPVAGSIIIGLLVGAFGYLPNVIWFHAPLNDALVGIADDVIAITLAGAVIGKFVLKTLGSCKTDGAGCGPTTGSCGDKKTSCN